jgi:hypothetical protein
MLEKSQKKLTIQVKISDFKFQISEFQISNFRSQIIIISQARQTVSCRLKLRLMSRMTSLTKSMRILLTPALIFWMAGVGCIFSCERGLASAEDDTSNTATVDSSSNSAAVESQNSSCPSHRTHDCCVKKHSTARIHAPRTLNQSEIAITLGGDPSKTVESCPMAINAGAIASKVGSSEVPVANNQSLPESIHVRLQPLAQWKPTILLDRESTHLRCCVFLI